jgi:hypothetical protein
MTTEGTEVTEKKRRKKRKGTHLPWMQVPGKDSKNGEGRRKKCMRSVGYRNELNFFTKYDDFPTIAALICSNSGIKALAQQLFKQNTF